MVRDDLISLVAQRLGNRADLTDRMIVELKLLQDTTLEHGPWLPWFLSKVDLTKTTTAGSSTVSLPTDFLAEDDNTTFWVVTTKNVALKKMEYEDMMLRYPGSGQPKAYAQVGGGYVFGPTPDAVYSMVIHYYAKDTVLSTNIENKWLQYASDVVSAELGVRMARTHMQHEELAAAISQDLKMAWTRLFNLNTAYQENSRERVMES